MTPRTIDRGLLRHQIRGKLLEEAKDNLAKKIVQHNYYNRQTSLVESLGAVEVKKIIDFILINKIPINEMSKSIEDAVLAGEFTSDRSVRDRMLYEFGITKRTGVIKEGLGDMALEAIFGFGPLLASLLGPATGGASFAVEKALGVGGMIFYGLKARGAFDKQDNMEGFMHMLGFMFSAQSAGVPGVGSAMGAAGKALMKILSPIFKLIGGAAKVIGDVTRLTPIAKKIGEKIVTSQALFAGLNKISLGAAKTTQKAMAFISKINFSKIPLIGKTLAANWAKSVATITPKLESVIVRSKLLGRLAGKASEVSAEGLGKVATAIAAKGTKLEAEAAEMIAKSAKTADDPMLKMAQEFKLLKGGIDDMGKKTVVQAAGKSGQEMLVLPRKAVEEIAELTGKLKFFGSGIGKKNVAAMQKSISDALGKSGKTFGFGGSRTGGKAFTNAVGDFTQGMLRMTDDFARLSGTSLQKALAKAPASLKQVTIGTTTGQITGFVTNKGGRFCLEITNKAGNKILKPIGGKTLEIIKSRPKLITTITDDLAVRFGKAQKAILKRAQKQAAVGASKKAGAANAKAMAKVATEFSEALGKGNLSTIAFVLGHQPQTMGKIAARGVSALGSAMGETKSHSQAKTPEYKRARTDESLFRALNRKSVKVLL